MFIGTLLIILGALMLLDRFGIIYGQVWDYFLPAVVIALGIHLIVRHKSARK